MRRTTPILPRCFLVIARAASQEIIRKKWKASFFYHAEASRKGFYSDPARVEELQIYFNQESKPVCVQFRNYSSEKRKFMSKLVEDLMKHKLVHPNLTSRWTSAPLILPKPRPPRWNFKVQLRPENGFTTHQKFTMTIIERELAKLAKDRLFANFYFVHYYWQLALHPY